MKPSKSTSGMPGNSLLPPSQITNTRNSAPLEGAALPCAVQNNERPVNAQNQVVRNNAGVRNEHELREMRIQALTCFGIFFSLFSLLFEKNPNEYGPRHTSTSVLILAFAFLSFSVAVVLQQLNAPQRH